MSAESDGTRLVTFDPPRRTGRGRRWWVVDDDSVNFGIGGLDALVANLWSEGYEVHGPVVCDDAVVVGVLRAAADLPVGVGDEQEAGTYRLVARGDRARFGYALGPQSWKRLVYPPRTLLWRATRSEHGFTVEVPGGDARPLALVGVRPCELVALRVLDTVLLEGEEPDPVIAARRAAMLVVTVDCHAPTATCFCASMGTGPFATDGFDLALTELVADADGDGDGEPRYVARAGSTRGEALLASLDTEPTTDLDRRAIDDQRGRAADELVRTLDLDGLPALLDRTLESPRWDDVASRCLACANCTLVCPTCFCHTVEDTTDLTGEHAERWRRWDSCFTEAFSHLHGGPVRATTRARYRQWLTHKLGTWPEQFGTFGCVGCGRCITWCPAAIDLTVEVRALHDLDTAVRAVGEELLT